MKPVVVALVSHAGLIQLRRCVVQRETGGEFERVVVEAGLPPSMSSSEYGS